MISSVFVTLVLPLAIGLFLTEWLTTRRPQHGG